MLRIQGGSLGKCDFTTKANKEQDSYSCDICIHLVCDMDNVPVVTCSFVAECRCRHWSKMYN